MNVAFASFADPSSIDRWSGIPYFIVRALRALGHRVETVMLRPPVSATLLLKRELYPRVRHLRFDYQRHPVTWRHYARTIEREVRRSTFDAVLCPSSIPLAMLDVPCTTAFWTDATFAAMVGFYPEFSNLAPETLVRGEEGERSSIQRASVAGYSSSWAAESAISHYGLDPARLVVCAFGANLERPPRTEEALEAADERSADICRLLFCGTDWTRKGGDRAVEIAERLIANGVAAELTVVGCEVPPAHRHPWVREMGFLSKASHGHVAILESLFKTSHFLVLPARADCTPCVVSEASAFALPSITSSVGGLPSIVSDGVNGYAVRDDDAGDYATLIAEIVSSPHRYAALCSTSRQRYERQLNWETAVDALIRKIAAHD